MPINPEKPNLILSGGLDGVICLIDTASRHPVWKALLKVGNINNFKLINSVDRKAGEMTFSLRTPIYLRTTFLVWEVLRINVEMMKPSHLKFYTSLSQRQWDNKWKSRQEFFWGSIKEGEKDLTKYENMF